MTDSSAATSGTQKISIAWLGMGLLVLLLDQLSKAFITAYLPVIDSSFYWYPYGGIGVFRNFLGIEFSINHMTNTGAAWGVLGNYQLPLVVLRITLDHRTLLLRFLF